MNYCADCIHSLTGWKSRQCFHKKHCKPDFVDGGVFSEDCVNVRQKLATWSYCPDHEGRVTIIDLIRKLFGGKDEKTAK